MQVLFCLATCWKESRLTPAVNTDSLQFDELNEVATTESSSEAVLLVLLMQRL
jgi:hypothetical protein